MRHKSRERTAEPPNLFELSRTQSEIWGTESWKKNKNGDSTKTTNNDHNFELCHQIEVMRIFVVSFRTVVHDTVKAVLLKSKNKTISNYRVKVAQRDLVSSSTSAGRHVLRSHHLIWFFLYLLFCLVFLIQTSSMILLLHCASRCLLLLFARSV